MSGLIIGLLITAFSIIVNSQSPEAAVSLGLSFLFYWHVTCTAILALIPLFFIVVGIILCFSGKHHKEALQALFVIPAVFIFIFGIQQALFVGSVIMLQQAGANMAFSQWDITYVIIGIAMYAVAIFNQNVLVSTSKKLKNDGR